MTTNSSKKISSIQKPYLTIRGVCYDLSMSPYNKTIHYGKESINYRFSSEYYLNKFKTLYESKRNEIATKLINKLSFNVDFDKIIDVITYSKVEKRGFCIIYEGEMITCKNNIDFVGSLRTPKIYKEQSIASIDELQN